MGNLDSVMESWELSGRILRKDDLQSFHCVLQTLENDPIPGLGPVFSEIHGQVNQSMYFLFLRFVRCRKAEYREVGEGNLVDEIAPVGVCHHGLS